MCKLTKPNYEQFNSLFAKYKEQGLNIAAFPCNQFLDQEPGCAADLKEFMSKNNVTFDVYAKIDVNGDEAHPLYQWLKSNKPSEDGEDIKWNFT